MDGGSTVVKDWDSGGELGRSEPLRMRFAGGGDAREEPMELSEGGEVGGTLLGKLDPGA